MMPHCATLCRTLVTSGTAPVIACVTMRATTSRSGSLIACGMYAASVTDRTTGTLRNVIGFSSGRSTGSPRGPRSGRFAWYGELSSQPRSRAAAAGFAVPGGVCVYVSVMRSDAIVAWYVCRSRLLWKGPGTKSRAVGSDDGGDWIGCSGPRSYLGGWNWYLTL